MKRPLIELPPQIPAAIIWMHDPGASTFGLSFDPAHPHRDAKAGNQAHQLRRDPQQENIARTISADWIAFEFPRPLRDGARAQLRRVDFAQEGEDFVAVAEIVLDQRRRLTPRAPNASAA